MSSSSLLLYPLPQHVACVELLDALFQGHVVRCEWTKSLVHPLSVCGIVQLDTDEMTALVLQDVDAAEKERAAATHPPMVRKKKRRTERAVVDEEVDPNDVITLAELFAVVQPREDPNAAASEGSYGDVVLSLTGRSGRTTTHRIFIHRSPVHVADIVRVAPNRSTDNSTKPRSGAAATCRTYPVENEDSVIPRAQKGQPFDESCPARPERGVPHYSPAVHSHKIVFDDGESGEYPEVPVEPKHGQTGEVEKIRTVGKSTVVDHVTKQAHGDNCRFCGSSDHLSRQCPTSKK